MQTSQFSSVAQSCLTLWPHGLQHARLPCPSPTPGAYSNSCPLSWWCHPTISSSVVPFSSCLQSFAASGSLFQWVSSSHQVVKTIGASASVLPMNIQDWFPLGLIGLISLLSKGLLSLPQHYNSKETSQRIRQKVNVNIELLCEHWQVCQANWSDSYPPLLRNFTRIMVAVVNLLSATTLDKTKGLVLANQTTLGMDLPAVATSIR